MKASLEAMVPVLCDIMASSIQTHEKGPEKDWALEGVELCRRLKTLEEFRILWDQRCRNLPEMYGETIPEEFQKHHWVTGQVEYATRVLEIASGLLRGDTSTLRDATASTMRTCVLLMRQFGTN